MNVCETHHYLLSTADETIFILPNASSGNVVQGVSCNTLAAAAAAGLIPKSEIKSGLNVKQYFSKAEMQ